MKRMISFAMVAALMVAELHAQQQPNAPARSPDEQFLLQAAASGVLEVRLGELAVERASNAEVKQFGQRMRDDHAKANKELLSIRGARRLELPDLETMPKEKALLQKLSGLKGTEFDRQYIHHMVEGHKEALQFFEKAIKECKDEAVRAYAEKHLPALREHLQMAKKIAANSGVGAGPQKR
jgi:putative membrane protein